ncbi:DNA methyltransferase [Flavobacterium sp. NRK F7]|uniref:class I SAM-dependent DNA methyltransferase n=1 Tax=Flavobacterium sp. NRK F7 TaxID=2954930 RepID=UPI00209094D8|nr:DNA methyltransferase [Flavobacterium sp. NRK F7]MCO6162219.1 class I SAM-dependent DNA methyltransferase [Flavobacterium sp. NRK F7]
MNKSQIEKNLDELVKSIDKENFIYDLLMAYGISKTSVTRLKKGDFNLSKVEGEVLYKKKVLFKEVANDKLLTTIDDLTKSEEDLKHNPRFVIVTDYKTLLAKDIRTGVTLDTPIKDLNKRYDFFLPWAGQEKYQSKNENHADRKASYEMAKLYDILVHENPNIYDDGGHNLNIFLSRLLFCFFAEDTNIFPNEGMFTEAIAQHTKPDGSDTHLFLDRLFRILNTEDNSNEPDYLIAFPYVNGGLFRDDIHSPIFSSKARKIILECGDLDWSEINPDIFGSMIQAVVNDDYRSGLGMHYTSVPNIMKVIEPLFLNELREEFERSKGNVNKLRKLIYRISKIKIFDPACGSGNFLIIAYKELRRLEIEIIKEINTPDNAIIFDGSQSKIHFTKNGHQIVSNAPQAKMNFAGRQTEIWFTEIKLSQFYGIELDDFAHEMAILSLWLAEHQMNKIFVDELHDYGRAKPILPLKEAGNITEGNATRLDWKTVCPIDLDDEVYILGNPPYLGARLQDEEQKKDMSIVFNKINGYNNMDYIACWFYLGAKYIQDFNAKCALVSTNSICQGEQVALIWPNILNDEIEIDFAHQSFKWTNNAKGNAGVTVIIVGLRNKSSKQKYLYIDNIKKNVLNINSYLVEGNSTFVLQRSKPLSQIPEMCFGSMPNDGGHLSITIDEFKNLDDDYKKFVRPILGGQEFIKGIESYCLWIDNESVEEASKNRFILEKIKNVKVYRENSPRQATNVLSNYPHQFGEDRHKETESIIVPATSSEKRNYIPIGFLEKGIIIKNSAQAIYNAQPWVFGLVTSKMHMIWVKNIGGKLKTDYRYSAKLCYNTFPFPEISAKQKETINLHVFGVLDERAKHPSKTLAQLYDPEKMPMGLKEAHQELDLAIERCYRLKPFDSDTERLEYLFKMYEEMTQKNNLFQKEKKTKKAK